MSIGSRIKEARINKKLTQEELAKSVGVTKSAIANYENEVSCPKMDVFYKLFSALDCDANYFYQDDMKAMNDNFIVTLPEQNLITKYRNLDEHGAKLVNMVINEEYDRCMEQAEIIYNETVPKPSYQCGLSAGTGQFVFDDVPFEMIGVPIQYDNIDFVIGVSGDSMEPTFFDSEKVMIQKCSTINLGDIGAFMVDGESYVKELGKNRLISHNKAYSDILFEDKENITLIGKVVGKLP